MTAPDLREVYDPAVIMWTELCEDCYKMFIKWRDAPNPAAWANPKVQVNPHLLAFLASCRVAGPSPQDWRDTVSRQLLLIRRICTRDHAGTRAAEAEARRAARHGAARPVADTPLPTEG